MNNYSNLFFKVINIKVNMPLRPLPTEPLCHIKNQMAKLVDALVSGTSVSNDVQVRVLFWAQERCNGSEAQGRRGILSEKLRVLSKFK
jgi:hypothetical protein